nr:lipoprotein [uncultured Gellertiella sp.]
MPKLSRSFLPLAVALGLAVALSSCGRKGDLDPPSVALKNGDKYGKKDEAPAPAPPDKPFLLDPLL